MCWCLWDTDLVSSRGEKEAGLSCSEKRGIDPPISHSLMVMMIPTCRGRRCQWMRVKQHSKSS